MHNNVSRPRLPPEFGADVAQDSVAGEFAEGASAGVDAGVAGHARLQRLFVGIFGDSQESPTAAGAEMHPSLRLSVGLTAAATIVLGLCSDPIIKFFRDTAASVGL